MKNNMRMYCAVLLMLVIQVPAIASAQVDDLWGLYVLAKFRDPAIGKAGARLESNKADEDIALSMFAPRVDAQAGVNWIAHTTKNYSSGNVDGSFQGHNYGFGAKMPIFQLPNFYNLEASKAALRGADAALKGVGQELITRLCEAYLGILKAQGDEQLYRGEMKRQAKIYEQAQAFLKAGTGDIYSVYEAKARLDSATADLVRAESQRKLAEQKLAGMTGRQVKVAKELGVYVPEGPTPPDLQWWLDAMQKNQPNLVQARELLTEAEEVMQGVRARHMPVLQASAGYTVNKGSTFLPEVETRQWYIGLNVSVPIFSGGETVARTRSALASQIEQRYHLEEIQEQQMLKLKEIFLTLESNISIINALRQKKSSAEVQLAAMTKGRSKGTQTAIDFLNAEQAYAVSLRDLSSAIYDNVLRRFQLKAAAGILTEDDLMALSVAMVDKPVTEVTHAPTLDRKAE